MPSIRSSFCLSFWLPSLCEHGMIVLNLFQVGSGGTVDRMCQVRKFPAWPVWPLSLLSLLSLLSPWLYVWDVSPPGSAAWQSQAQTVADSCMSIKSQGLPWIPSLLCSSTKHEQRDVAHVCCLNWKCGPKSRSANDPPSNSTFFNDATRHRCFYFRCIRIGGEFFAVLPRRSIAISLPSPWDKSYLLSMALRPLGFSLWE